MIETLEDNGRMRLLLIHDEHADEPYDEGQSPLLQIDTRTGSVTHVMTGGRPEDDDGRIEEAAQRWHASLGLLEKYLRAFHGATQVTVTHCGLNVYVTYDTARWREYSGAPANSVSMDEWLAWCEGDTWTWAVQRLETWHAESDASKTTTTWETVDACSGFYGYDYAVRAAREAWWQYVKDE